MSQPKPRQQIVLTLQAAEPMTDADFALTLRQALKRLLRSHALKCVDLRTAAPMPPASDAEDAHAPPPEAPR